MTLRFLLVVELLFVLAGGLTMQAYGASCAQAQRIRNVYWNDLKKTQKCEKDPSLFDPFRVFSRRKYEHADDIMAVILKTLDFSALSEFLVRTTQFPTLSSTAAAW
jgi:hypothetical protein